MDSASAVKSGECIPQNFLPQVVAGNATAPKTSLGARLPSLLSGLTIKNLPILPLDCADLALALSQGIDSVEVELLSPSGIVKRWSLSGTESALKNASFMSSELEARCTHSGISITVDILHFAPAARLLPRFLQEGYSKLTHKTAHASVYFEKSKNQVIVRLNHEPPFGVKIE